MPDAKEAEIGFEKLSRVIKERQQFEATHSTPPFSTHKTDINYPDVEANTLLHYAAAAGDLAKVKKCLEEKADINQRSSFEPFKGEPPLVYALKNGFVEVAQYLYEQGADCSQIELADIGNHPKAIQWFKEKLKASLDEAFPSPGSSADIIAHENSFFKKSENYPERSALVSAAEIGDLIFIQRAFSFKREDVQKKMLTAAVSNGQLEVVKFLFKDSKVTPEMWFKAIGHSQQNVIDFFLTQEIDINESCDNEKDTPLMYAIHEKNKKLVKQLIDLNADITKTNIWGETALHIAARVGDPEIIQQLLQLPQSKALLDKKNMFGWTPLTIAIHEGNDAAITALAPTQSLTEIKQSPQYRKKPIAVGQSHFINKMFYYLKNHYRDTTNFSVQGLCNGLSFLFQLFKARGMRSYFFSTLQLIVSWDGTQAALDKPFGDIPQAKFYKNLGELLEQWINDAMLFQTFVDENKGGSGMMMSYFDRIQQYALSGGSKEYAPHFIYQENDLVRTEAQLKEFIKYLKRMPQGVRFDWSGGQHATSADNENKSDVDYYDSNIEYTTEPTEELDEYFRRIIDHKYHALEVSLDVNLTIYYFEKDAQGLWDHFEVFSPEELPKNKSEAEAFQKNSANKFTHLHVAVITHSLNTLRALLKEGYCDINAENARGDTVLAIACRNNNSEVVKLILESPALANGTYNFDELALKAYRSQDAATVQHFINSPQVQHLNLLLSEAITRHDVTLVEQLVTQKKVDLNANPPSEALPLTRAMTVDDERIVKILLENGANIHQPDKRYNFSKRTPLLIAMQSKKYYPLLIEKCSDINYADNDGNTLMHHAATEGFIDVLKDLVSRGANPNLKNANEETPLQKAKQFVSMKGRFFEPSRTSSRDMKACKQFLQSLNDQKNEEQKQEGTSKFEPK